MQTKGKADEGSEWNGKEAGVVGGVGGRGMGGREYGGAPLLYQLAVDC